LNSWIHLFACLVRKKRDMDASITPRKSDINNVNSFDGITLSRISQAPLKISTDARMRTISQRTVTYGFMNLIHSGAESYIRLACAKGIG
jgi:hypothetical protein